MNLPTAVAGRTQPTVAIPGVPGPDVSVQTINHQTAGIDLGCTNCSSASVALRDAATSVSNMPTWAKVLAGLTFLAVVVSIIAAIKSRR